MRFRRGQGASPINRGVWLVVASAASLISGHTRVRPRRCHGQRRLRPNRCPPLYSTLPAGHVVLRRVRPPQCHGQRLLSLNRCPRANSSLPADHLLQKNCRPQFHNQRLLRLNCCPLANPMISPSRGLYPAVIAMTRDKRRCVHAATCHAVSHAKTRGSVATAPRPSLGASGCRSGRRDGSHYGPHSSTTHSATTPPT